MTTNCTLDTTGSTTSRLRRLIAGAAALGLVMAASLFSASSASAATNYTNTATMSCTAQLRVAGGVEVIAADVRVTIYYYAVGGGSRITKIGWSYSNARRSVAGLTTHRPGVGAKSNLNIRTPLNWNSPDSLGGSGTYDTPDFTVVRGYNVTIEAIPDVAGFSDPRCSVSRTM